MVRNTNPPPIKYIIVAPKQTKYNNCPKCKNNIISTWFDKENIMLVECEICGWDFAFHQKGEKQRRRI
ncbi:MAG: hypothetical protein AABY32_03995 [Nanoarchaeota archaeon]